MAEADRDEMLLAIFNLLVALAERITGDEVHVSFTKDRWATEKKPKQMWLIPSRAAINWIPPVEAEGPSDAKETQ